MNFNQMKEKDNLYIMNTYHRVDVALAKGKNATAWDIEGKQYIDFTSGIGVNSLGFVDQGWSNAIQQQLLQIQHMSNYYYSPSTIELAEQLSKATGLSKAFFCNSGAEANECAIKVARKYGEKKAAYKIITLSNSFHGRTITTLAATAQDVFHQDFLPLTDGFIYGEMNNLDSIQHLLKTNDFCGVMLELVQGEGGVIPSGKKFIKNLEKLCRDNDVLLIIDEIQTGIGRTGTFMAYEQYDIQPDIVTIAKGVGGGLPIAVCLVAENIKNIMKTSMNGSTFGGNPVASAGALEVVKRINQENFLKEVKQKGNYIIEQLSNNEEIEFVRGLGLMIGIGLKNLDHQAVLNQCAKEGLLILTAKGCIRFLPPLTISYQELENGITIFKNVILKMKEDI